MSDFYTAKQIHDFLERRIKEMENNTIQTKQTYNYQVIGVNGTYLHTFHSFWAEDDKEAVKLAGKLRNNTVLCRVVEDVQR